MVEPMNGRRSLGTVDRNASSVRGSDRAMQVDGQRSNNVSGRGINRNDAIRLDNNDRTSEINQNAGRQQEVAPARRGGFFGNMIRGNNDGGNIQRSNNVERAQPSRSYEVERSQPSRSYTPSNSAPSRSFSSPSPAPSRSFGGGSGGGGGARMGGGRR
jgi:hypothetical protein